MEGTQYLFVSQIFPLIQKLMFPKNMLDHTYNKDRTPYSLTDNNCGTFASDVINQDKNVKKPWWSIKTPTNMVDEFQEEGYEKVFYNSETQQTTFEKNEKEIFEIIVSIIVLFILHNSCFCVLSY